MKRVQILILAVLVMTTGVLSIQAQDAVGSVYARRPVGLRISTGAVSTIDLTADINLTVNTETGTFSTVTTTGSYPSYNYNYHTHQFAFGMLGDQCRSWSGWGYATMLNPTIPALDAGDGTGTINGTTVPMVAGTPGSFRGSFTHTFPDFGDYQVTCGTTSFWLFTATPNNTHLSQLTAGTPYLIPPGANFTTANTYWGTTYARTWPTQTSSGAPITDSYAIGVTNSTSVKLREAIPTLGILGMLILAAVLGGLGVFILRRSH